MVGKGRYVTPSVSFADVSLSREYPVGEPRKATCLSLWERSYSPHRGNVCEADKRVWARYEPYQIRRIFRRGFLLPQSASLTAPSEKEPAFRPLSPADSFAQPQTATLCLLSRHLPFKGVPSGRAKKDSSLSKEYFP